MKASGWFLSSRSERAARKRTGCFTAAGRSLSGVVSAVALFCTTAALASPEMSYTNWPSVTEWADLTNHISWCYRALSERLTVANRASETNDITPSYTWPYSDYTRFAQKIDSITSGFADQTKDRNDHFKSYLISQKEGKYPTTIPCWVATNLHLNAFAKENWSTNSPLHSWMGSTNHSIQVEIQSAITCLVWTVAESSEREDHTYYQCSQYGSSNKAEPCYCDADPYPSGHTNNTAILSRSQALSLARGYEVNRWANGKMVDGCMGGWGDAIYAVGAMLYVTEPDYLSSTYTYTFYGARMYAKPVLNNVCTDFVAQASVFLSMRHYRYDGYSSYNNYWYTYDYNTGWFAGTIVQTNHLVFAQEFDPPRTNRYVGYYPFYDMKSVNPVQRSRVYWASTKICEHIYCDTVQWLLKWNVAGGVSMAPPPVGTGGRVAETPDVDRDDIVEVPADMRSLGRDSGTAALLPECDNPAVLIPLAATPAWFGSLPVHAYLSQGAFTNLPYTYHVRPHADDDGYYTAYSLNTHIEESGALTAKREGRQKRVELVRPRGNIIIFDFKCEADGFSDKGYPIGANNNRTYVLRDLTPDVHDDKRFDLYFSSGVVHEFDDSGCLAAVRNADGRRVTVNKASFPAATLTRGAGEDGPSSASDACYSVAVTWDRGTLKKVEYSTVLPPTQTVTATVALDNRRFIQALSKSGGSGAFAKSDASVSGSSVTYGSGVKVTRSATAEGGVARTVTIATTIPNIGVRTQITEFDVGDKIVRSELAGAGVRAVTRYAYVGGAVSSRYSNGFPKQAKLKQVTRPDGARETREYSDGEGWLIKLTEPSGAGFDRITEYSYDGDQFYDSANVTNAVERPRKVENKVGNAVVGKILYRYLGAYETFVQVCTDASAEWEDEPADNIASFTQFYTDGMTAGLPREYFSYMISADNTTYLQTVDGGKLTTEATCGDGRTVTTCVNVFGTTELSCTVEEGKTTDSISSTVDSFGRPLATTSLSGTTGNGGYGLYGPATVTGVDGSTTEYEYYDHGPVKHMVNNSTAVTTDYGYDPLGDIIKTVVAGGGKTVTTESSFDSLGRMTSAKDALGGTTTYGYDKVSFGGRKTTALPSGGSIVEERYFDGSVKRVYGSAAAARVSFDYGIDGSSFYSKAKNDDHNGEYTVTYYNFLGKPARIKRSGAAGETVFRYDGAGRPIGSSDETGIAQINTYNDKNRPEHTGVDVNRNGEVDLAGSDAIETQTRAVSNQGLSYETKTYQTVGNSAANSVCSSVTAFDGLSGSFSDYGRPGSFRQSGYAAQGAYSVTVDNSDGTTTVSRYERWRLSCVETSCLLGAGPVSSRRTEYEYDGLGRLECVRSYRNGVARATRYARDAKGRVTSVLSSDGAPGLSSISYDGNTGRVKRIVRTDGSAVSCDYDDAGHVTREYDTGAQDKRYAYDALGRLFSLTAFRGGAAQTTQWNYDEATGLPHTKTLDGAVTETYAYRDNGQLQSVSDANGVTASLAYDEAGNVTGLTASDGTASITHALDRLGRPTNASASGGISVSYALSDEGLPLGEAVSGNGIVSNAAISRTYAGVTHGGLLSVRCAVGGGLTNDCGIGYDPFARVSSVSGGTAAGAYLYPGDTPLSTSVTVSARGCLLTRSVQWDFDNVRPLGVAYSVGGAGVVASFGYQYAPGANRVARETLAGGASRVFAYDGWGRLVSADSVLADGSTPVPGQSFAFSYDSAGNVTQAGPLRLPGVPRYSFACDSRDVHVSRAWGSVFEISGTAVPGATVKVGDKIARRQGGSFWAAVTVDNVASAVRTNIAVTAFRRDPGRGLDVVACATGTLFVARASETPGYGADAALAADSRFAYAWDAFGRLASAVSAAGPDVRLDVRYYPDGRRASKTVSRRVGAVWTPVRTHQFHYDAWNLVCETVRMTPLNATNAPVTLAFRYLWGPDLAGQRSGRMGQDAGGIGGLLAVTVTSNGTDTVCLPLTDGLGNVRGLVDAQTGALAAEYAYDPYGAPLAAGGPAADLCPFRFQTKYWDAETGLYCFGFRYFDPLSCKWLRRDPKGEAGGVNLTAYCDGDPVNGHDPFGLALYAFDGTWEHMDEHISNIGFLFNKYNPGQGLSYYRAGVGNRKEYYWPMQALGGFSGAGARGKLESMYQQLVESYNNGDHNIDIVGFSRGGAMAVEFANMIAERGIPNRETAYSYTRLVGSPNGKGTHLMSETRYREKFKDVQIRFIGLFDVVESFVVPGDTPLSNIGMHTRLPSNIRVKKAVHVMSENEHRTLFPLTDVTPVDLSLYGSFVQVSGKGDHSDLGGGHGGKEDLGDPERGLSNFYLNWMIEQANSVPGEGPLFLQDDAQYPYDLSMPVHDLSGKLLYKNFPNLPRDIPPDVQSLTR